MRARTSSFFAALGAVACVVASAGGCSLDLTGAADATPRTDGDDGGAPPAPTGADASSPGALPDAAPCEGAACSGLPPGWSLVAFASGATAPTACPPRFVRASHAVVEGAHAAAGACACSCSVTTPPSCAGGDVDVAYGSSGTCGFPSPTLANAPAGGCGQDLYNGTIYDSTWLQFTSTARPTGGVCAATAVGDATKVTFDARGLACAPDDDAAASCAHGVCAPELPAPFEACLEHDGETACPSGSPYVVRHVVGESARVDCPAGSCGCSVSATCRGTITLYTDDACTNEPLRFRTDATCRAAATPPNGRAYYSYRFVGEATSAACTSKGAPSAPSGAPLTNPRTVCCGR